MKKANTAISSTALIAVISIALLVAACQPVIVQPNPQNQKQITVTGTAELQEKADQVIINLGFENIAPDAATSQRLNAETATKIVEAVRAAGISADEISTSQYSVYEWTEWDPQLQKSVSKGYRTTNTVQIKTTRLDIAGAVIDAAAKAGANRVDSVSFGLTKEKESAVRKDALRLATASAKDKAEGIADGLGSTIKGVASASEAQVNFPINYVRGYETGMALAKESNVLPPISAGELTVSASVNVAYDIE
jgi:uncharacterized protein YggE